MKKLTLILALATITLFGCKKETDEIDEYSNSTPEYKTTTVSERSYNSFQPGDFVKFNEHEFVWDGTERSYLFWEDVADSLDLVPDIIVSGRYENGVEVTGRVSFDYSPSLWLYSRL